MKIKKEHYEYMKTRIIETVNKAGRGKISEYKKRLEQDTKVKDINVRFRWDIYRAANLNRFVCEILYGDGINDNHIDTALKKIIKELNL